METWKPNDSLPASVVDEIFGAETTVTYSGTSGGSLGQVTNVHEESSNSREYDVDYTYASSGDRETALYTTPNGSVKWKYKDYATFGQTGVSTGRAFQTLNKQSWTGSAWVDSTEEFHYQFDSVGRITYAAFAQTPHTGETDYATYAADHRAIAKYVYEPGGRITKLEHWWQDWDNTNMVYVDTPILSNECSYNAYTALKTSSTFKQKHTSNSSWVTERTENFGYDADLDYLTSADYNDGLSAEEPTWTYDAAGNRMTVSGSGSPVYDNLNRMTTDTAGKTYTNDILGNRLTRSGGSGDEYQWDDLNRLAEFDFDGTTTATVYEYRADGMRTFKKKKTIEQSRYYYDGQMPMEEDCDVFGSSTNDYVIRNGLGARGVDYIAKTQNSTTTVVFPAYDAHGNNIASISRNGTGFSVNDRRAYDAWGGIRQGNTTGDPKGRYCANLGHIQDDESGLVYMRARYYEPANGRFINEDPSHHKINWFLYCSNDPINKIDLSGKEEVVLLPYVSELVIAGILILLGQSLIEFGAPSYAAWIKDPTTMGQCLVGIGILVILTGAYCMYLELLNGIINGFRLLPPSVAEQETFEKINEAKMKSSDSAKIGAGLAEMAFWMVLVQTINEW